MGTTQCGPPTEDEQRVCAIADALRGGDEVLLNSRSRPIEVLGREIQRNQGLISGTDYPYRIVWLRGNGTEYRLRYSHLGDYYPHVHTESELETHESFSPKHGETRLRTWSKPNTGERVTAIAVEGVDADQMADWVLSRNIERSGGQEAE